MAWTQKWRNRGAPFPLPDGTRVERGDVFEASSRSRTVKMRRHKLRPVKPSTPVTVGEDTGPDTEDDAARWVYPGIEFGSNRAFEIAKGAGLMAEDLEEIEGTGADGSLLAGDVRSYLSGG